MAEQKPKKPNFIWRSILKDGKGVDKKDVIVGYSLKNLFRLYFRRLSNLVTINLFYIFGNFPALFLFLAISGYFSHLSSEPTSPFFPVIYGIKTAGGKSPVLEALFGAWGGMAETAAPTTVTYILLGIGALFIFTFGLVNVGCTYLIRETVRGEHIFIFDDFFSAIKNNFGKGLLFGIIDCGMLFACGYSIMWYYVNYNAYYILFFCSIFMTAVYLFLRVYMYLMIVTFDIKFTKMLKNAFIFSILNLGRNVLALLACVALCAIAFMGSTLFMPIGIILAILILFSTMTYISVYAGYPKVERLMIDPYYKNNSSDDDPRENIPERTGKGHIEDDED